MKKVLAFILISVLIMPSLLADDGSLEETLNELSGKAATGYVGPIVSAFGTSLNGGWFHKVPKAKLFNIDVELGFVFMGSFFPDDEKDFNTTGNFRLTRDQAELLTEGFTGDVQEALIESLISQDFEVGISGPTIIGDEDDEVIVFFPTQYVDYELNGTQSAEIDSMSIGLGIGGLLSDMPFLPLFAPQLGIGTVYGTKLAFRYLPPMDLGEELGEFKYFGFGIQHNPKAWLLIPIPINVCASFFTQTMELGNYITAKATAFGINASKTFGPRMLSITPYAGLMLENSKMEFKYDYVIDDLPIDPIVQKIKFEIEGENKSRIILGTTFRLGIFSLNADYNIGKYNSFTAGFGLAF